MSNEARISAGIVVQAGALQYMSRPPTFAASMVSPRGPSPGLVRAQVDGTDVDLSALTRPGFCLIQNLDTDNYVEYGEKIGTTFRAWGELGPGEQNVFKFSRNFGVDQTEPGTATTGVVGVFHVRANIAPCDVNVHAFDS